MFLHIMWIIHDLWNYGEYRNVIKMLHISPNNLAIIRRKIMINEENTIKFVRQRVQISFCKITLYVYPDLRTLYRLVLDAWSYNILFK